MVVSSSLWEWLFLLRTENGWYYVIYPYNTGKLASMDTHYDARTHDLCSKNAYAWITGSYFVVSSSMPSIVCSFHKITIESWLTELISLNTMIEAVGSNTRVTVFFEITMDQNLLSRLMSNCWGNVTNSRVPYRHVAKLGIEMDCGKVPTYGVYILLLPP